MKNFKEYRSIKSGSGLITEQQFMTDKGPENLEVELVGPDESPIGVPTKIPLTPVKLKKPGEMGAGLNMEEPQGLIEAPGDEEVTPCHLITKLLNVLPQLRIIHWNTTIYPLHIATGATYEALDEIFDKFVETYQAYNERVKFCDCLQIRNEDELNIEEWVCSVEADIESLRSMCPQTDLQNILDEVKGTIGKFKYLLTLK